METLLVIVVCAAAATWLVTVLATTGSLARVRERGDAEAVVARARRLAPIATLVALPAALVVAAGGVGYVLDQDLALGDDWWIGTAIGAWLVCVFGSTISRGRQLASAVRLSADAGVDHEEVQWRIRRVDLISRGEALLLVVAIAVVAWQPGLDAFGSF